MSELAILNITDGTESINLLELPGLLLESWRPQIPFYKGGGTFQQSPLSSGRQLVNKQFDNWTETFVFKVEDISQNDTIFEMQEIRRLLEKASDYWSTDWQDEPVWIEAKAKCETNTRYGLIVTGYIPDDENPYSQPFGQVGTDESVMDNMTLIIEHLAWTENQPGTGMAVELSAVETYDGRNLGNVDSTGTRDPTTSNEVYVANKRNEANLTDIYVDDGGVFGPNLMDAALPYNLLPAVPVVNDAVYFGIDTSLADSGPFASLVFDIGTAGSGYSGVWEYWNGGAWAGIAPQDNTGGLQNTGVNSVHWSQPINWATTAVNAITGYWVRYRVTATPGPLVAPTQQNRDVYSIVWPYVEIQSTQVLGDIEALSRIKIYNQSATSFIANELSANRYILGLRQVERGQNFTAFLNLADEQNPSGITISATGGFAFVNDVQSPTGRVIQGTAPAGLGDIARVDFDSTILPHYYGDFHLFLRITQATGSAGDVEIVVTASAPSGVVDFYQSQPAIINDIGGIALVSIGKFTLPPRSGFATTSIYDSVRIEIQAVRVVGAPTLTLYDMILIPVDEWSADTETASSNLSGLVENGDYLEIDSITQRKLYVYSNTRDGTTNNFLYPYKLIVPGVSFLQSNKRQRLWILGEGVAAAIRKSSQIEISESVEIFRHSQYKSMRGAR